MSDAHHFLAGMAMMCWTTRASGLTACPCIFFSARSCGGCPLSHSAQLAAPSEHCVDHLSTFLTLLLSLQNPTTNEMFPIPMQRRAVQQLLHNHNVARRLLGDAAAAPALRRRLCPRHLTAVPLPTNNNHYNPPFAMRQQQQQLPQVRGFFVHVVPPDEQQLEQEDASTNCVSSWRPIDCIPTCGEQDDDDGG